MDNGATMQILECLGQLVYDEADMDVLEYALRNDVMQVCLHELKQQINVLVVVSADSVHQFDNVGVVQLLEDLDFAVGALGVGGVLEGIEDLLESEDALGGLLLDLPDVAVGTRADLLEDVEATQDVRLDEGSVVLRHSSGKLNN